MDAKEKRTLAIDLLTHPFPMSNRQIAQICQLSPVAIGRYKKLLETEGIENALLDGRVRSGRRISYADAYKHIEAIKTKCPRFGGREIWAILVGELKLAPDTVPSIGRIDGYLSERRMIVKVPRTGKADKAQYLQDPADSPLARVGMDYTYPFHVGKNNYKFGVLSIRDWYSGAVYSEAFPQKREEEHFMHGLEPATMAGVYVRFVQTFGIPRVLVLDNGAGQITSGGWLPEIARYCLHFGTIVEWEPYGRPWKNGAIERWNRDLQKWYAEHRTSFKNMTEAFVGVKHRTQFIMNYWKRIQLGDETVRDYCATKANESFYYRPTPIEDGPLFAEPLGRHGFENPGIIRMMRTVETDGYVQLHGSDFMHIQEQLAGGYVRIEFEVKPNNQMGNGTVKDGHGDVVATFKHYIECNRPTGERLVPQETVKLLTYSGNADTRTERFDQELHNRQVETHMKRARAAEVYKQTKSNNRYAK